MTLENGKAAGSFYGGLRRKAAAIRRAVLNIHRIAPEVRIASSLSPVELFTVLYHGGLVAYKSAEPRWAGRDRVIASKGHGSIALFPILAEAGYFDPAELGRVGKEGAMLGSIPDIDIPGYEAINGSLGHGPGVACGICLALKRRGTSPSVYVLVGDGELYEGAVWEAVMFAAHHKLDNLVLIVDYNKVSMLGPCKDIVGLEPLAEKFRSFGWEAAEADGHNVETLHAALKKMRETRAGRPKVLVAHTVKGKGVPELEADPLSHVRTLRPGEIERALGGLDD